MAGIGFEIRKLLQQDSYLSTTSALAISGLISSGPWLFSILGIFLIGAITSASSPSSTSISSSSIITEFSVMVTYLIAFSLIITGPLQLVFTRFIADKVYESKDEQIIPNLLGVLCLTSCMSTAICIVAYSLLPNMPTQLKISASLSFITLTNLWMVMTVLSGIKAYKSLIFRFFLGYAITVILSVLCQRVFHQGLLLGFYLGQASLLGLLIGLIFKHYPAVWSIQFQFLKKQHLFPHLLLIGLLYNVGIWSDKFIFWFTPYTSEVIIEPLRASIIYDLPIFFSYLTIVTGMSMFLIRMETDFAETCQSYFRAIHHDSLDRIHLARKAMVSSIHQGLYDVFKVQLITAGLCLVFIYPVFETFNISPLYIPLFSVLVIAIVFQMTFLSILNVCFYLEFRFIATIMCLIFFTANLGFSYYTTKLDVSYYGLGYLLSTLLASLYGWIAMNRTLPKLERYVFFNARKHQ